MSNLIFDLITTFEKRYSEDGVFIEKKLVVEFKTEPCELIPNNLPGEPVTGNVTIEYLIVPTESTQFFTQHRKEFEYDINFSKGIFQTTTVVVIAENEEGVHRSESASYANDEEKEVIKPVDN